MNIGDKMQCKLLANNGSKFVPTGKKIPVEVRQIKRNHMTQEAQSVKVRTLHPPSRIIWVQAEMLSE
jgi:hypothetical protein